METYTTLFKSEADIFYALSHPTRLEILDLLRDGECCVCHIQAMLDQRQAYISQHLNILRQAGLIGSRKDGQRVYYKISDPGIFEILDRGEAILHNLSKWNADNPVQSGIAREKKPCNCPQCTGQINLQPIETLEAQNG